LKAKTSFYVIAQIAAVAVVLILISLPLESASHQEAATSSSYPQYTFTASSCASTSTTVTNMLPVSSEAQLISMVNDSFSEHLGHFSSRETFAVTNDFEDGAQMVWSGRTGFGGNYTGLRAINEVYEGFLEPTTSLSVVNESWTLSPTGAESAVVYSTLNFTGHNNDWGNFDAQVLGRDYYVAASGWKISQEFWNFTSFYEQYPITTMFAPGPSDDSCYH
jgi:hypothetical protein